MRQRRRGRHGVHPAEHIPDTLGQLTEHQLQPLALKMRRIMIQLSRQRPQRAAAHAADHDLPDQVPASVSASSPAAIPSTSDEDLPVPVSPASAAHSPAAVR